MADWRCWLPLEATFSRSVTRCLLWFTKVGHPASDGCMRSKFYLGAVHYSDCVFFSGAAVVDLGESRIPICSFHISVGLRVGDGPVIRDDDQHVDPGGEE